MTDRYDDLALSVLNEVRSGSVLTVSPDKTRALIAAAIREVVKPLESDINRLRALILQAEWSAEHSHGDDSVCPWCRGMKRDGHYATCPAFTSVGSVVLK